MFSCVSCINYDKETKDCHVNVCVYEMCKNSNAAKEDEEDDDDVFSDSIINEIIARG